MHSLTHSDYTPLRENNSTPADYITLLKPGVMALVVFTGFTGMWLAPGELHPFVQLLTVVCIALGSGAGAAFNMWYDRDIDPLMQRTAKRPIPQGRITPGDALAFAWLLTFTSVTLLSLATNLVAGGMLAFAIFFYAVIYTQWLKRTTSQNIVIGGAAGAFPPVIGWVAMTGDIMHPYPWVLFLITFFWTPPHFWALALYRNADYARARVPMLPAVAGETVTKWHMAGHSVLLIIASLIPAMLGWAGVLYGVTAMLAGGYFLYRLSMLARDTREQSCKQMFGYSIVYLFIVYCALCIDYVMIGL